MILFHTLDLQTQVNASAHCTHDQSAHDTGFYHSYLHAVSVAHACDVLVARRRLFGWVSFGKMVIGCSSGCKCGMNVVWQSSVWYVIAL